MIKKEIVRALIYSFILTVWSIISGFFVAKFFEIKAGLVQDEALGDLGVSLLFIIILAPVFETLLTQTLVHFIVYFSGDPNSRVKWWQFMIASSILFGLIHYYNIHFILMAIVSGFILAYAYQDFYKRGGWIKATVFTIIIHALNNGWITLLRYYG